MKNAASVTTPQLADEDLREEDRLNRLNRNARHCCIETDNDMAYRALGVFG